MSFEPTSFDPTPRRKPGMSSWVIVGVLGGGLFIVFLAVVIGVIMGGGGRGLADVDFDVPPAPEQGAGAVWEVADSDPAVSAADRESLLAFFHFYHTALVENDADHFDRCWDIARLLAETEPHAPEWNLNFISRRAAERWLDTTVGDELLFNLDPAGKSPFRILHIEPLDGGDEVIVITRQCGDVQVARRRWWLYRDGDLWRLYDMEYSATQFRYSQSTALWNTGTPRRRQEKAALLHAIFAANAGDFDRAERLFARIRGVSFARPMDGYRWLMEGKLHSYQQNYEKALECFAKAESLHPGMPAVTQLIAAAHNALGDHEAALQSADHYITTWGGDADIYSLQGQALAGLGRNAEAADAFRNGLADGPMRVDLLAALGAVLPEEQADEIGAYFLKLPDPAASFETIADGLTWVNPAALESLSAAYRRLRPTDPLADYYDAAAKMEREQYDEAGQILKDALERVEDDDRRLMYVDQFLWAWSEAGKTMQAYDEAPDADYAFRELANYCTYDEELSGLEELIERHRANRPPDAWLHYYAGVLHAHHARYEEAEQSYLAAAAEAVDDYAREKIRAGRVRAAFLADKAVWAYQDIEPKEETFPQLAELAVEADNADLLEQLIGLHYGAAPDDSMRSFWQGEAHWLRQDYDAAVRAFRRYRSQLSADEWPNWRTTDRLVRSLARLNRTQEALIEAQRQGAFNQLLLPAVVYAMAGDVEKTVEALQRFERQGYYESMSDVIQDDPDLGPAWNSEAFAAAREQYFRPTKTPAEDPTVTP